MRAISKGLTPNGRSTQQKPVDIAKKPIDSESYKLYYVNYKMCRNPKSTACHRFSG